MGGDKLLDQVGYGVRLRLGERIHAGSEFWRSQQFTADT
jgi:hypothetical protein